MVTLFVFHQILRDVHLQFAQGKSSTLASFSRLPLLTFDVTGVLGRRRGHYYNAIMRVKREMEASVKNALVELQAAKDDLGRTMAQCAEAASRAERLQTLNLGSKRPVL